jgi:hypothetical protein
MFRRPARLPIPDGDIPGKPPGPAKAENPWASRWRTFKSYDAEDQVEDTMLEMEAREAEAMPVEKCGKCGDAAFYRPGVGAYQCGYCRAILVTRKINGEWVDEWR